VPFDNLRKMIALKSENKQALPGLNASDFFENWVENGAGATGWPMANAFYELLISIGFDAQRITGYMRDLGVIKHGSVKVLINGVNYIADASLLLNQVLLLDCKFQFNCIPPFQLKNTPLDKDKRRNILCC
jgi:hypothetical protein